MKFFQSLGGARRALMFVVAGAAFGIPAFVLAAVTLTSFEGGTTISASQMNANFVALNNHKHNLGITVSRSSLVALGSGGGGASAFASCPAGSTVVGGGCNFNSGAPNGSLRLISSYPTNANIDFNPAPPFTPAGWWCFYENSSGSTPTFYAYALCLTVQDTK